MCSVRPLPSARLAKLDQTNPHEAWVRLPRFKTSQEIKLVDILKSMGMLSAFNEQSDFSGMDGRTGGDGLFICDAIHSAVVEVNEAGTEAAAVTLIHVKTKGMIESFNANHPFLFLIREKGSGSMLFLGRIVDPTKQPPTRGGGCCNHRREDPPLSSGARTAESAPTDWKERADKAVRDTADCQSAPLL
jgi:hypothetical protein